MTSLPIYFVIPLIKAFSFIKQCINIFYLNIWHGDREKIGKITGFYGIFMVLNLLKEHGPGCLDIMRVRSLRERTRKTLKGGARAPCAPPFATPLHVIHSKIQAINGMNL